MIYLDPAWLRREYLTWHRSLDDIAAQIGCPLQTLNRFARDHGIPVRSRGTSSYIPTGSAPGTHPRDLPEPLRSALIGPRARRRLDRLLFVAGHASILAAAQHSASGKAPSTTRSPSLNAPAAARSSTAVPPSQAPPS